MDKYLKISLYILLIIAIVVVALLMLGNTKPINLEPNLNPEILPEVNEEIIPVDSETINKEDTSSFEEDVMKDLESFFGNTNWYENIGWDFWFTDAEAE